ncbi:RHS repeat-associated core domain-containing protein [Actinomadura rayongensis]|uniref:Sugar-binding protein n=1 Tax=Actinomadura rayongensis TaxID=1429076 RepID=A0A6I4W8L6_9ACTN|nr:RHS repeat-associated core domain-containing protein [Actinomadura rayongensis]MXQ65851.1 sugar-binding protein [Actinomadura rayongensis]
MRRAGFTGWIDRGWAAWVSRARWVRALVALALIAPPVLGYEFFDRAFSAPHASSGTAVHDVRRLRAARPAVPTDAAARKYRTGNRRLPSGGSGLASFDLTRLAASRGPAAGRERAGRTPVWAQPIVPGGGAYRGPKQVAVQVAPQKQAYAAGVRGVLFTVAPRGGTGAVQIGVDYGTFKNAYGGDFGSRLRLVRLPSCVLTTPQLPACRTQSELRAAGNRVDNHNVYAPVALAAAPTVLAATSGTGEGDGGGAAGTYAATTLKPSGTWGAGGSTGSFTYSYPFDVPPAASSLVPTVGLNYDSGAVDGQTASTQTQASWAGDGWSLPQSFVEQSFVPCSDSPEGSAAPKSTADECYDGQILTLSLNGASTPLVWDATKKTYTPAADHGEIVKHVTGANNGSGTHDTDYWQITDRTGTTYTFGRNRLPGWSTGKPTTNSVDSLPVYSAHSGDPCYNATWTSSWCTMAYRWNLDYVTDVHGNAMAYYYKQDTNAYARDADTSGSTTPNANATYDRDSHLDHIDYGFTDGAAYSVNSGHAPDQVLFTTGDRCLSGTCDPLGQSTAANWPDVPYDLNCTSGQACKVVAPSFWSTVRLTGVKTQQWNGSAYAAVDSWSLTHTFPANGDGTSPTLWLSSITRTGSDTTAGGSAVTLPSVTFTAKALANRVDTVTDGLPPLTRMRISSITTETGSVIGVNYTLTDPCSASAKPAAAGNTSSCYPVYWTPHDVMQPLLDWFNKYQVSSVTQSDPTGGGATLYTGYKYLDGGAWHYDDNELVKAKYRTYGQWRGFGRVQTFTGQGSDPQTKTETTYYRGMSKNNGSTVVTLTDSQGGTHEDTDQFAGAVLESTTYDYSGGPVTGSTITSYWTSPAVATRTRTGLPALTANAVAPVETWTRQAVTSGGTTTWRKTETDTSYDADASSPTFGLPLVVYTHGDLADATQRRCAVTTYAPVNATANVAGLPAEVETDAAACGGTGPDGATAPGSGQVNALTAPVSVNRPTDVVSDERTYYDNVTLATTWPQPSAPAWPQAAPTKGDVSEVRVADGYTGGAFTYRVTEAKVYDSYGRVTDSFDGLGRKTHVDISMTNGLVTGQTTTNPLNQTTTETRDPLRGLPVHSTDLNGIATTTHYDGLGRVSAVWGANRATTVPATVQFTYDLSKTAPTVVTTKTMNEAQGYITSTTLYDALLRARQVQKPTPQGGRLVTDTFYDSHGWTWKTNGSWWDPNTTPGGTLVGVDDAQVANQTVTEFDGSGRPVLATSYYDSQAREQTATAYYGDKTVTVPPQGNPATATYTDALGRTTELDRYTTRPTVTVTTGTGTAPITRVAVGGGSTTADNGRPQAIKYVFNKVGQQTGVQNLAAQQTWTTTYDLLNEPIAKDDPDAGSSTLRYDAVGNLVQTTDARGKTVSFTYDALNRKTGQYDAPVTGQASANQMASWVYDNSNNAVSGMTYPVGQLTTSTSYIGGSGTSGQAYTTQVKGFNVFGKPLGETVTLPSAEGALASSPYTFTHTYTANTGLPWRTTYPASGSLPAETVTTGYSTALDLPNSLAGLSSYQLSTTYDAMGQATQRKIGNTSVNAYVTNTYDPHTGRLADSQTANTNASSTPIDHNAYAYDAAGNPIRQTTTRLGTQSETQCFGYDTLDRLTQAWTATDNCVKDPSTSASVVGSGIAGGAYWTTWELDALGQRKKQVEHGLGGTGDRITAYSYDGNATGQPHTLTSTTTTVGGAQTGTSSFTYDKSGNTTQRNVADGNTSDQQTLTWDDTDELTAVTTKSGGTSYIYDASGNLLLQKSPTKATLFVAGEEITLDRGTGSITGSRFCALPGGGQIVRTGSGSSFTFKDSDLNGTALFSIGPAFTDPNWRQQTPYGAPRGTAPNTWPDGHGFLDKPQDTVTGLTSMGARWYDPVTGRFVSLDPVFQPDDDQQQNGYTYAGSNPVTRSDPSGLDGPLPPGEQNCLYGGKCDSDGLHDPGWTFCHLFGLCGHHGGGGSSGGYNGGGSYGGGGGTYGGGGGGGGQAVNPINEILEEIQRQNVEALLQKIAALKAAIQARKKRLTCTNPDGCIIAGAPVKKESHFDWGQLASDLLVDGGMLLGLLAGAEGPDEVAGVVALAEETESGGAGLRALYTQLTSLGRAETITESFDELEASIPRAEKELEEEEAALGCHSFAGATKVLMADGSSKPIDQIKVGDKIANAAAGVPKGTRDKTNTVTAVHVTHTDRNYTDVTIATPDGPKTIVGTSNHPYWDATTHAWTLASQLRPGDHLQTIAGQTARILTLHSYTATRTTYDLTVNGVHTYYVEAGNTSVLVHNGSLDCELGSDGWPKPTMDNCEACAQKIQEKIGGKVYRVSDSMGAPKLGPSVNDPTGQWFEHYAVIKDGTVYDAFTGPNGMPLGEYRSQWEYGEYLKFTPHNPGG